MGYGEWRYLSQSHFQQQVFHFACAISAHPLQEGRRANKVKTKAKTSAEGSCLLCHVLLHTKKYLEGKWSQLNCVTVIPDLALHRNGKQITFEHVN